MAPVPVLQGTCLTTYNDCEITLQPPSVGRSCVPSIPCSESLTAR